MRARLIRFLFSLHRWMGVVLGLLMLMWCLSGVVMMYSPYPAMSQGRHDYRIEGLAPLSIPPNAVLPPADIAPPDAKLRSARFEMLADRPVLRLAVEGGGGTFDLTSGAKITEIDEATALAVARVYADRHGLSVNPTIKRLDDRDEFTVSGGFNSGRPYYQVRLNDPAGTLLYISSKTGDVRQRTTTSLRVLAWLGAIPHWLYFTELRKNAKLWSDVVIWTSLAGCFLAILGLFIGIRQFRRRHSTEKLDSPYRGAKYWHHMFGLVFGVLVLTWTFSGFTSMNPWGWLESGPRVGEAVDRLTGEPPSWSEVRPALEAQLAGLRAGDQQTVTLASTVSEGKLRFVATKADGPRLRLAADGTPAPYDDAERQRAAALLAGGENQAEVEVLQKGDAYYYSHKGSAELPVVRITVPAMDHTRFYLDTVSGDVVGVADAGARGYRWWHQGLHRMDFFGWLRARPVWDIVTLVLMAGVTAVCALGAWMGLRKLARGGRMENRPES